MKIRIEIRIVEAPFRNTKKKNSIEGARGEIHSKKTRMRSEYQKLRRKKFEWKCRGGEIRIFIGFENSNFPLNRRFRHRSTADARSPFEEAPMQACKYLYCMRQPDRFVFFICY